MDDKRYTDEQWKALRAAVNQHITEVERLINNPPSDWMQGYTIAKSLADLQFAVLKVSE